MLAIGIDQYQHVGKLRNAVRDAQMVSTLLTERYFFLDSQLLINGKATRREIRRVLRQKIERLGQDHNLVIYFSGHGHYDKVLEEAYWVPVDARFGDDTDYISYEFIKKCLAKIKAHHILLIVDSCYSGAIVVRSRTEPLERFEKNSSRWMLASGRNEVVPDGVSGKNSPFATQLLDVLSRYSGEGLRVSELINKVTTAVIHDSFQTPIGRPLFQVGDKGGEFIFRTKQGRDLDWEKVIKENTVSAYNRYIKQFPGGVYIEEAFFSRAKILDLEEGYTTYIDSFPKGKYIAEIQEQLHRIRERIEWEKTDKLGTIIAYKKFLSQYPNGEFAKKAKKRCKKLKKEEEEERRAWGVVSVIDSEKYYQRFLKNFPGGRYEKEARIQLEKQKEIYQLFLESKSKRSS